LGVAAYGHSFFVDTSNAVDSTGTLALYPAFDKAKQPLGDSDVPGAAPSRDSCLQRRSQLSYNSSAGTDQCGNTVGVGGTFNFNGMIAAGFLDANGDAASGMDYRFDNCSQTVRTFTYLTY